MNSRVSVIFRCSAQHEHPLCVTVPRRQGVPPELQCPPDSAPGYGGGGNGGCSVPPDLPALVERELRDNLQESKRRGFVLIRA